jgi:protein CpxP
MKRIMLMCCLFLGVSIAASAQSRPGTTDPVEKAKELQQQLKLTDKQTAQIAAIYTDSAEKFDKIKTEQKGNNDKMLVAIRPLRAATVKKLKQCLTTAQVAKYEKMVSGKDKASTGWSDGWSSTASN